jgi:hypothetical protein
MLLLGACDGFITSGTEKAWQEHHARALLPGYADFKGLEISADVGVAIFSYRLPPAVPSESAAATIAQQIENGSCYQRITQTADDIQLRCKNPNGPATDAFEEYRIHVNPGTRRVTVMYGDFDSRTEIDDYPEIAAAFTERAKSQ